MKIKEWPTEHRKRSELNPAPYNPRFISDMSLTDLRKSLQRYGMVQPIIWNQQTGFVVGGHQRLRLLDADRKYDPAKPETDYHVEVKTVDLPDKEEKALNLALNNQNLTGQYDGEKLAALLAEQDQDIKSFVDMAGWSPVSLANEMESLGMETEFLDVLFTREGKKQHTEDTAAIQNILDATTPPKRDPSSIEAIKERKEYLRERDAASTDPDYYASIVFRDGESKRAFFAACGVRDVQQATYNGHEIAVNLGIDLGDTDPDGEEE